MKQKIKRLAAVTLTGTMAASMLTGCGSKTESVTEAAKTETVSSAAAQTEGAEAVKEESFQHDPVLNELGADVICKEKTKLSIGVVQSINVEDYDTNWYTQMLETAANVDIDFVIFPADGYDEKLRMMVTGGEELPDIIMWKMSDAQAMVWGEEGYLLPLEDYFEHSSYYAKEAYDKVKENGGLDILDYMTLCDGHIWSFPKYLEALTSQNYSRMYIWYPWLEALGLEVPTNTEELYDVLMAFKTQDPNGNGIADEIPMLGCGIDIENNGSYGWEYLMNAFTPTSCLVNWLVSEDGQLSVSYAKEEFKEGLKYIRKLVAEGLYDPISFTQDHPTYRAILRSTGDHTVGAIVEQSLNQVEQTTKENWLLLEGISGPDGTYSVSFKPNKPSNCAYITADCEHPEVAFRVLDLMCREDFTITARWGKQGENWDYITNLDEEAIEAQMSEKTGETVEYDWANTTFAGYPAYIYEFNNIWGKPQNMNWYNENVSMRPAEVDGGYYAALIRVDDASVNTPVGSYLLGDYLEDIADNVPKEPIYKVQYADLDKQMEAEEIEAELKDYVYEKLGSWLTGMSDVEAEWDTYLNELEQIGLSRYLELAQECWNP